MKKKQRLTGGGEGIGYQEKGAQPPPYSAGPERCLLSKKIPNLRHPLNSESPNTLHPAFCSTTLRWWSGRQ